jgi:hypothetical protein
MTINIFYKTTVSCEDSLDPGPEERAGLRQDIPGEVPITSFIFWIRSLDLMLDIALTLYSETPHTKKSKRLQSAELGSQTFSTHTSVWLSLSQSCILLLSWAGVPSCWRCNGDFQLSKYILRTLSSHICPVHLD